MSGSHENSADATEEPGLWEIRIAVVATASEHELLLDRFTDVLCPDANHEGPCAMPWAMHSVNQDALSRRRKKIWSERIEDTNPS